MKESKPCFCQSNDDVAISEYHPFVICKVCGLIRLNPRLTQETYRKFYDKEYHIFDDKEKKWPELVEQGKGVYKCFLFLFKNIYFIYYLIKIKALHMVA